MVAIALSNTMFTKPISTAPPKMVPLDTSSALLPPLLFSRSPTLLLSLLHTPIPPSTRYRNATAIIQTKNNATDSTNDTFSVLHGSTRRICMLARTGPWARPDTWMGRSVRTGVVDVSGAWSAAGLRCPARGIGPDRSGSSLVYASSCRASASGDGVLAPPGAAVPEMKRLNRASALGLPEVRLVGRGFGASDDGRGGPCEARAPPCGRGAPSTPPPRSTEPFPFGLSPGPGCPGSFGEVTPRLLTVHPAAGAVGDRSRVGRATRIVVGHGAFFSFLGVACDG